METEILLRDGNFIRRTTSEQILGGQEHLLSSLTDNTTFMLPNFMPFGDATLHLLIAKSHLVLATELKSLPMSAFWRLNESDHTKLTIDYGSTVTDSLKGSIRIADSWPIPDNAGRTLFCLHMVKAEERYVPKNCYLLQYLAKDLYVLPYPNVYADGRICMGLDWEGTRNSLPVVKGGLMSQFVHAHTAFHATTMNRDLTTDYTREVFVRNLNGWEFPSNMRNLMRSTSLSIMSGFSL